MLLLLCLYLKLRVATSLIGGSGGVSSTFTLRNDLLLTHCVHRESVNSDETNSKRKTHS